MWKFSLRSLVILGACLLALFFIIQRREIHVYDGFESASLSYHRSESRMVPGAFRVQSEIVRADHRAGEITVRLGDRREPASDDGNATERDELMEA